MSRKNKGNSPRLNLSYVKELNQKMEDAKLEVKNHEETAVNNDGISVTIDGAGYVTDITVPENVNMNNKELASIIKELQHAATQNMEEFTAQKMGPFSNLTKNYL